MTADMDRNRFMKCFHCHEVMYRKPLPPPRDAQVQHKCNGKVVTRKFGIKFKNCKSRHTKSKLNPNGACLVIITKEEYCSQPNDGRYKLIMSELEAKTKKKQVDPHRRRAVKATAKRRPCVRAKKTIRLPAPKRIVRKKKAVSGRRTKKQKRTKKKRISKAVKTSSMPGKTIAALLKSQCSIRPKPEVPAVKSKKEKQLTISVPGVQAVDTGSSRNPITLDSDEEKSKKSERIPVDEIRIGEFCCRRTRFDYPSVQCFENVLTLYVWDKKRNDEDEREGKESFEVDIPYSKLTWATFNKCSKFCYCLFETSASPLERRSNQARGTGGSLEGKFVHNSSNFQKRSIVVASVREEEIIRIRKHFLKNCPDGKKLKAKGSRPKSKEYLKYHGLKTIKRRGSDDPKVDKEQILVYPKNESAKGAVLLTLSDVRRLQPGVYLNDNLLDFYMQYLFREKFDDSLRKRVHLFNTFFFKKWTQCTQRNTEGSFEYDASRYTIVSKWTKNVDIFSKDFLVIPVNHKLHWTLAIVCFPGAVVENQDSKHHYCILGFDSLKMFRRSHFEEITKYLNMAWKNRAVKSVRYAPFSVKRCIPLETPCQTNGADCGVFVLHNCEKFFENGGFTDYKSPSPGVNWYPNSEIMQKRKQILELISKKTGRDLLPVSSESSSTKPKVKKVSE